MGGDLNNVVFCEGVPFCYIDYYYFRRTVCSLYLAVDRMLVNCLVPHTSVLFILNFIVKYTTILC